MSEWIKTKDELPDTKNRMLVTIKQDNHAATFIAFLDDGIWYEPHYPFGKEDNITHWMPLPEPAKE